MMKEAWYSVSRTHEATFEGKAFFSCAGFMSFSISIA